MNYKNGIYKIKRCIFAGQNIENIMTYEWSMHVNRYTDRIRKYIQAQQMHVCPLRIQIYVCIYRGERERERKGKIEIGTSI